MSLLIVSFNVMAEWTKAASAPDHTTYLDLEAMQKNGNNIKVWILTDFDSTQVNDHATYSSIVTQAVIDCPNEAFRVNVRNFYPQNMGIGMSMHTYIASEVKWAPIIPDSFGEIAHQMLCKK